MKTGAKIAIGCVLAVVLIGIIGIVGVVGFGFWAQKKVASIGANVVGNEVQINKYLTQARANSFTPPADGVITESQLLRFLDVRKRVFAVYQQYGPQFESLQKQKDQGAVAAFQGAAAVMSIMKDVRLAQAQALADVGMSPREYMYLVTNVYKTYYQSEIARQNGGRQASEVIADATKNLENISPPPAMPGEDPAVAQMRQQQMQQVKQQMQQYAQQAKAGDVPQANLDLFKKYDTELKKYIMPGLEMADVTLGAFSQ